MEKHKTISYYNGVIFIKANPAEEGGESDTPAGRGGGTSFVLAHLSDPHLSSLTGVRLTSLLNKRLLGYLSWHHHRRRIHCPHIVDPRKQL